MMKYSVKFVLFLCAFVLSLAVNAQKKPLGPEAYGEWKRVDSPELSEDGKWVAYRVVVADDYTGREKDPCLYLWQADTRKTFTLPGATQPSFWGKGKWLSYVVKDTSEVGHDSTILLNLRNMKKTVWDKSGAFAPLGQSERAAWTHPVVIALADSVAGTPALSYNRLVVLDLVRGDSVCIDSIGYYTFYDDYRSIAYIKEGGKHCSLRFGSLGAGHRTLYTGGKGEIRSFHLNAKELTGTFSVASDSLIYAFSLRENVCRPVFRRDEVPVPEGYRIQRIDLSDDQEFVTYELSAVTEKKKGKKPEQDKSFELELWTWDEDVPQSRQAKNGYRSRVAWPTYIYYIGDRRNFLLAPASAERIIKPSAVHYDHILFTDETPYYASRDWKETPRFDVSLVNIRTGKTQPLLQNLSEQPVWSPNGKYALIYSADRKAWYKVEAATGQLSDISAQIGHPVYDEEHDKPCAARSYGIAGWSTDGNQVVVYDRYDLWVIDLTGAKEAYSMTKGYGRKNHKHVRLLMADYDPVTLSLTADNLVETFDEVTKNEGVYRLSPDGRMQQLTEGPFAMQILKTSGEQKYCIFNRQSYTEFRDLWWSKTDFARPVKITDVNPQQKEYNWGSAKLVSWTNYEGKPNEGILYLPEGYDPQKKYPLLVQFYETHTGEFNVYHSPTLSSAMADIPTYVSNGYIVFTPDVHFTIGDPGQSCYDAVVSGVQMLIDKGIADREHIGLQGHSWSGFQTAFLVTRIDLFRCANIGAPIVDMVSGYVGIRNGSGLIRFFMYEDTQSRMGKSLWDDKEGYQRNSPLLNADKITTPLLIFHCDEDEAVAYEQGRALYLAMRRLQKPAWLLNYKGDGHFLSNPAAQRDWTIRMQQFYDYYLKDAPMPRWMKEGINVNERGIDQKYDHVE